MQISIPPCATRGLTSIPNAKRSCKCSLKYSHHRVVAVFSSKDGTARLAAGVVIRYVEYFDYDYSEKPVSWTSNST
jgi:hypothetical protein